MTQRRSSWQRLLGASAFALLLLFAQQHATLHWLSHSIAATHAKPGHPLSNDVCDECIGIAALSSAAPSAEFVLPVAATREPRAAAVEWLFAAQAQRLAYRSRAPPIPV